MSGSAKRRRYSEVGVQSRQVPANRGSRWGAVARVRLCRSVLLSRRVDPAASRQQLRRLGAKKRRFGRLPARHGACSVGAALHETSRRNRVGFIGELGRSACAAAPRLIGGPPRFTRNPRGSVGHESLPHFWSHSPPVEFRFGRLRTVRRFQRQHRSDPGGVGGRSSGRLHPRLQWADLRFGSGVRRELRLVCNGRNL